MSIPTARDLVQLRAESGLLLPDVATITDPGTVAETASGGTTIATPVSVGGIPCRLSRTGTQPVRNEFGEQLTSEADYMLTVPVGTAIKEGWTVTISGVAYTVMAVALSGSWGSATRALVGKGTTIGG